MQDGRKNFFQMRFFGILQWVMTMKRILLAMLLFEAAILLIDILLV